jgi:membrane-associated HD superfamily phosphohydrolase
VLSFESDPKNRQILTVVLTDITIMRNTKPDQVNVHNTFTWALWVGIGSCFWIVTFVVSNAIPIFSLILNISAAIFISWFTFGLTSVFWFHLNWKQKHSSPKKIAVATLNYAIIAMTVCNTTILFRVDVNNTLAFPHDWRIVHLIEGTR